MAAEETLDLGETEGGFLNRRHGHRITILRQLMNILGCLLTLPCYYFTTICSRYPVTLDILITIALAELNRFVNEGRRRSLYRQCQRDANQAEKAAWKKVDAELQQTPPRLECLAAIVGWREEPELYRRALESYKDASGCAFLLAGIDGDEEADQEMAEVFNQVYPSHSKVIRIPEPLGEVAERVRAKMAEIQTDNGQSVDEEACNLAAIQHCIALARTILEQQKVHISGPGALRHLCIRQRHMHKKGIMFTTFVFALVIADALGIEFMWSSDSDTLVFPDSLERTVNAIAADPTIGGASSGLLVHNDYETAVTNLASTVYWGELYLTRSTPASTATSDCQSGPSTVFRLAALPSILVPWYLQTLWGKRMIINEDRHLTTNLLLRGWGVVYASDVLAATDTPTTMARWLKQQVRWARATHIESLLQPRVYAMSHPLLFYGMAKREFGPIIAAVAVLYYFLTSKQLVAFSLYDLGLRMTIAITYNVFRNPHRLTGRGLAWVIPGIIFYYIPLPAVHVWSMMTLTADGWGTTMRASGERAKQGSRRQAWFDTGFFVVWISVVAGSFARWLASQFDLTPSLGMVAMAAMMTGTSSWAYHATVGATLAG